MPLSMLYFLAVTPLSLVQVGAAISIASAVALPTGPMIGAVVDRVGAKQVLLGRERAPGVGFFAYLFTESFAAVLVWTVVVTIGRTAFWGSYGNIVTAISLPGERERWFGFLGALRNVGFAVGGLASGVALSIGTDLAFQVVVAVNAASYAVALWLLLAVPDPRPAGAHTALPGLVGDRAPRPALPAARPGAGGLLGADDDPELRAPRVRRDRAGPARLGHRRGVHHQLPDGRVRPGAGRQRDDAVTCAIGCCC